MPLNDLPLEARPREKLLAKGAAALSDVELQALLLRTGIAGKNVLHMAQELLELPRGSAVSGRGPGSQSCHPDYEFRFFDLVGSLATIPVLEICDLLAP